MKRKRSVSGKGENYSGWESGTWPGTGRSDAGRIYMKNAGVKPAVTAFSSSEVWK